MEKFLRAERISKVYQDKVGYKINLFENISFDLKEKEFTTILAPVGSGKTSLLKIIANLENPTNGIIETEIKKRIYIPTKPSSFPWLDVEENISFNLNLEIAEIQKVIDLVGLHGYENHFPNNKSEGFRFRISLGRALANLPELIILDEPFNYLNIATRKEIYSLVNSISNISRQTFLLGTTNITEAIFLSDKILLMKKSPLEIIDEIKISLPKERNLEMLESKEFIEIRTEIENIFKKKTQKILYNFSI